MPELPAIGLRLHGGLDPGECIELADIAEANGFASIWFAENPFQRGVMPAASACAWMTRRLRIGLGIVNVYGHHPTLIAMEFAALDELAEGRAVLGIGSGIGRLIEQMGFAWQLVGIAAVLRDAGIGAEGDPDAGRHCPFQRLAGDSDPPVDLGADFGRIGVGIAGDAFHILRGLLAGEEVSHRGRVFSVEKARLGFRPLRADPPIYVAAMGDRSLELCGSLADGLIVSNLCPPLYTERAVAILRRAAVEAGQPPPAVVQYVPCIPSSDRDEARRTAMTHIGEMMAAFWPAASEWPPLRETIVERSGIPRATFAAALQRIRAGTPPGQALDDRFVEAFAICGTAEECLSRAADYRRAGVDELVLSFSGADALDQIEYLGAALGKAGG